MIRYPGNRRKVAEDAHRKAREAGVVKISPEVQAAILPFLQKQIEEKDPALISLLKATFPNGVNGHAKEEEEAKEDCAALLAKTRFNPHQPPPVPSPLYILAGSVIATAENLMVVQAKMKAGKSAAIGAMIAATMDPQGDCLWFESSNPKKHAVIHFDTEQSNYDHHQSLCRALRRAGRTTAPDWLYSHHIKGFSIEQMKNMVRLSIEAAAETHGGVHSCILDGIADLCVDVNDPTEANELVAELERLAMKYNTLIVCVLHENQGSDNGKTRGHLGSQLARKAETNLRLEKDAEGVTVMFADTSRSVHITKEKGPRFHWSDEAKSHVSVKSMVLEKVDSKREMLESIARECFQNDGGVGLSWGQLTEQIQAKKGCSKATAARDYAEMLKCGLIRKKGGKYQLA